MTTYKIHIHDINGSDYKIKNGYRKFQVINPIEVTIQYYSKGIYGDNVKYMASIPELDLYYTGSSDKEVINGIKNKIHKMCYDYLVLGSCIKNDNIVRYRFILHSFIKYNK